MTIDKPKSFGNPPEPSCFFQKVDWLSFGLTTLAVLVVYLMTLAPDVTLDYSGIDAAAAMYPGPSIPPGHPLWSIYGWLFIKLIPYSNIAWRLNLFSAVAGASTCGLIALMVSRVGFSAAESIVNFKRFSWLEQNSIRVVCGGVAGLGMGLDGCLWRKAVVTDTWTLSLFLLALIICLLTRWFLGRYQLGYLFAASAVLGLTLSESQSLIPIAFALPFLVAMGNQKIGRELFFGISALLWCFLMANNSMQHFGWIAESSSKHWLVGVAVISTVVWGSLSVFTRSVFSEWKSTLLCVLLFLAGFCFDFLLPLLSMTDPPVNWGYPRTVEGFLHVLNREQFDSPDPVNSFSGFLTGWKYYGLATSDDFGLIYVIVAIIPFLILPKISLQVKRWLVGLLVAWFFLSFLMLVILHVDSDRSKLEYVKPFFAATHILLALLAGCGLILVVAIFGRSVQTKS